MRIVSARYDEGAGEGAGEATAVNATVVGYLPEGVEAEDMELWHAMHDPNDPEDADGEDLERLE